MNRWYHGGRETPMSIAIISANTVSAIPMMTDVVLAVDEPRTIVNSATTAPGRTHSTGSSHDRRVRAIIRRPENAISPPDGS